MLERSVYNDSELQTRFSLYIACGASVCVSSSICIFIFSLKDLRHKYTMFLALSAGEFTNGLAYFLTGIFRLYFMRIGNFYVGTYSVECFYRTPWSALMIFSGQFSALINVFIAMERLFALKYAAHYRKLWKEHYNCYFILLAFSLTVTLIALAITINLINHNKNPTRMCSIMQSTGVVYGTVHFTTMAIIYILCFFLLRNIFSRINRIRIPSKDEARKQKMLLLINGISVTLVSFPCVFIAMNEWQIPQMDDLLIGVIYCCYAMHSAFSLFVYIALRPDFRSHLFSILQISGLRHICGRIKIGMVYSIRAATK